MLKIATLFSGVGTPEIALQQLNIPHKVVFSCEKDKYARMSYKANVGTDVTYDDVRDVNFAKYRDKIDLLIGGSPCQSFSNLGNKKQFNCDKGQLTIEFKKAIEVIQPQVFIFENVKAFHPFIYEVFGDLNYELDITIYNTASIGVPQSRHRLYVVGFRKDNAKNHVFLHGSTIWKLPIHVKDILDNNITETDFGWWANLYLTDKEAKKSLTKKRLKKKFCSLDSDIAICITTKADKYNGNFVTDSRGVRRLSVKESFRLQGWGLSDDYSKIDSSRDFIQDWRVSDRQAYKQCGNAMSLNVVKAILQGIYTDG